MAAAVAQLSPSGPMVQWLTSASSLLALYDLDGRTQTELAKVTGVEQPTMALTLRRMERDGLIRRTVDGQNRRRQLIHVTGRAREIQEGVQSLRERLDQIAVARLTPEQHGELKRLLAVVTATLQDHLAA